MPVLYAYRNRSGFYAKARIQQAVVTFQITDKGAAALSEGGVRPEDRFPHGILLDLIRTGDAFTHGGPVSSIADDAQLELSFPEHEDLFEHLPKCEETGSAVDLHLVVLDLDGERQARILAEEARQVLRKNSCLSLPLSIVTLGILAHLESAGKIPRESESVARLRTWLLADRAKEWETLRNRKPARQTDLGLQGDGQGDLFGG